MEEVGLNEPTIILSNPPRWAVELYKTDKEKFFGEWRDYVEKVRQRLESNPEKKVSTVQILNEFNVKGYTPVNTEDLPRMCEIARGILREYNPDIKLMGTVLASNTGKFVGTPIEKYLPEFKKIKDSFDVIGVDYYPGFWHHPTEGGETSINLPEAIGKLIKEGRGEYFKEAVKDVELLKAVFEEIATWGKEYELGETGMTSMKRVFGGEKSQRYFYDAFFRAFKQMELDFQKRGVKLPSRVGFYGATDETWTLLGKAIKMGMRTDEGGRKMILEGSPHASPEDEKAEGPSQLKKIISYLRAPMKKAEAEIE